VVVGLLSSAVGTALPASLVYGDDEIEIRDTDTLRVVLILGNHWLAGAAASIAGAVIGVSSFVARRYRLYARWAAWAGLVASVLMLPSMLAFAGLTLVLFMIWTGATGIWLVRNTPRE
jgi:hypothetical protein